MHFVIGNKSTKFFIKLLKFLAKYGSDYCLEAKDNQLQIKTCSNTQIALAIVAFEELFFVKFETSRNQRENVCRISAKVLLNVLKSPKSIASITMRFDIPNDCIYVNVHKFNDVIIKNKVALLDYDELDDFTLPNDLNELLCRPSVFRKVLLSSRGIDELEFEFKKDGVNIQSYIDFPDEDCEAIRLSFTIGSHFFTQYEVKTESSLIASCEDFILFLNLAQTIDLDVQMRFSTPGRPFISKIADETYSLTLVQATLPPKSYAKRNVRNQSYNKVINEYVGRRKTGEFEQSNDESLVRAENSQTSLTTSNLENNPRILNETSKSQSKSADRSSQTYTSTPSVKGRANYKRRSEEHIRIEDDDDMDATLDNLQEKRQKISLTSTVVGTNMSIVLSQKEINEVNDIMANIADIVETPSNDDDDDVEMILPIIQPANNFEEQSISEVEMPEVEESEKTNTDNLFSYNRLSMHNSYLKNSDKNPNSEDLVPNVSTPRSEGALERLFGHIFKPRTNLRFGKILVPGSDSESED